MSSRPIGVSREIPAAHERAACATGRRSVGDRFRELVAAHPERVALIDGEAHYTYRDLALLASAYRELFRERLDVAPGHILVGWLDNSPEFVASLLAVVEGGAVFFPLNIHWRPAELRWFLERLPIAGVVTKLALRAPWDAVADRIPSVRIITLDEPDVRLRLRGTAAGGLPVPVAPDQPVIYLGSSGSSGEPKIVPRSHSNTLAGAAGTGRALGLAAGLRFMSAVPFYHGNGMDNSLMLPLLSGGTAVLQADFLPQRFARDLTGLRVDVLVGSPAIFELLVRFECDAGCLSSLRICASSGGPLSREIVATVRKRFGVTIRQVYGSSETGVIAVDPPRGGPPAVPVPTARLRILDRAGRVLPAGKKGEIAVAGPAVASGYVVNAARSFTKGFYRTGDRGILDDAGNLTLLGRIHPLINLSGTKVDPVEVERAILQLRGVQACRVSAARGPQGRETLKAVIAFQEGAELGRTEVIGHCRTLLAEYKIPRIVECVAALPGDLTGKRSVFRGRGAPEDRRRVRP